MATTKAQLNHLKESVGTQIIDLKTEMGNLRADINTLNTKFDTKFDALNAKFDTKFDILNTKFDTKFEFKFAELYRQQNQLVWRVVFALFTSAGLAVGATILQNSLSPQKTGVEEK
ncbi:hypothetical protein K432DRAFT_387356 [Lepidopterella palustris CBS 459.81]|uniref:Uncharacterized protein n=1 Tax=Lepidopterella palustris CBS 459.81 TaxID=1314670 RepID=A0A8E2J8T9_9PEZI|nr:hypothetical protein K432DRAFT_387356 [Lepidopterella palustris CBS 459.81]